MAKKRLKDVIVANLNADYAVYDRPHSARTLILRNLADDFQVGLKIDRGKSRGEWIEKIDLGMRIPSVEDFYDRYEIFSMQQMGFRKAEPSGWLTFWRPSYLSKDLEEDGLDVQLVKDDLSEFCKSAAKDAPSFRADTLKFLRAAQRPDWATEPGSTFLIIKALIARTLFDPDSDACEHAEELMRNEPVIEAYRPNIDRFCDWLRSAGRDV